MIRSLRVVLIAVALLAVEFPAIAGAITVDGALDPSYVLVSSQTTQTSGTDATQGLPDFSNGSELDAAYAAVDNGVLYLLLTGNLEDAICSRQACTDAGILDIFIDCQAGGQNPLLSPSPLDTGTHYPGLTFDAAFAPDYWIEFAALGALDHNFSRNAYYEALPAGGGGASYFLGSGSNSAAPGTLSGGTNPYGILATIDNRNTAGVAAGCGAGSGAGVTTGVELAIPLAAIGNPTGCIKVSVFIDDPQTGSGIINQVLGPLPAGTCSLGAPASVNFAAIAGEQFFTLCPSATPVRATTWGALKTIYR